MGRPTFKNPTNPFPKAGALKLRGQDEADIPTDPAKIKGEALFASLYPSETKNKLSLIHPETKTRPLTRSRSKTENDNTENQTPHQISQVGEFSNQRPAIDPTLSPSAIGRLKDQHKKNQQLPETEISDEPPKKLRSKSRKKGESIHEAETRVTRVSQTTLSQRKGQQIATSKNQGRVDQEKDRSLVILFALFIGTMGLVYYFLMPTLRQPISLKHPKYSQEEEKSLVQMHRYETGAELNSGRTNAEYKNMLTAPALPASSARVKSGSMMDGLPLQQENNLRTNARDRLEVANPNDPDHRVEYILQDEQQAQEWEERAQKEYLREFARKAHDAGYQVRINENLDVDVRRDPSAGGTGRRPGNATRVREGNQGSSQ